MLQNSVTENWSLCDQIESLKKERDFEWSKRKEQERKKIREEENDLKFPVNKDIRITRNNRIISVRLTCYRQNHPGDNLFFSVSQINTHIHTLTHSHTQSHTYTRTHTKTHIKMKTKIPKMYWFVWGPL